MLSCIDHSSTLEPVNPDWRGSLWQALQLEKLAREKETGLEQRERDLTSLEETFRAHVAESSARLAEASEREDRLVATHAQTRKDLSEARCPSLVHPAACPLGMLCSCPRRRWGRCTR